VLIGIVRVLDRALASDAGSRLWQRPSQATDLELWAHRPHGSRAGRHRAYSTAALRFLVTTQIPGNHRTSPSSGLQREHASMVPSLYKLVTTRSAMWWTISPPHTGPSLAFTEKRRLLHHESCVFQAMFHIDRKATSFNAMLRINR